MEAIRPVATHQPNPKNDTALRDAAMQLEASFLAEML